MSQPEGGQVHNGLAVCVENSLVNKLTVHAVERKVAVVLYHKVKVDHAHYGGESVELFKGNRVTMINIWGTFCSPCIREMPDLQKLSKDYESKGVKLIGIVVDTYDYTKGENRADKINSAKDIISQTGVEYMNVLPSASLNAAKLDSIISVPTTFFLNEKGELISSEVGSHSYDEWCRIIDRALERA